MQHEILACAYKKDSCQAALKQRRDRKRYLQQQKKKEDFNFSLQSKIYEFVLFSFNQCLLFFSVCIQIYVHTLVQCTQRKLYIYTIGTFKQVTCFVVDVDCIYTFFKVYCVIQISTKVGQKLDNTQSIQVHGVYNIQDLYRYTISRMGDTIFDTQTNYVVEIIKNENTIKVGTIEDCNIFYMFYYV